MIAPFVNDELTLGYYLAVAGAGVWSPRAISTWLESLGDARAVVEYAKAGYPTAPAGAETLKPDSLARLGAIDDATARRALDEARTSCCQLVLRADEAYPRRLRDLSDPPLVLYCRGDLGALDGRTIAIVGSRAATQYGRNLAAAMAAEFAAYDATVVSGLARGIDAAAHRGALDGGARTAAVIGSGICRLYPDYHVALADEIAAAGGTVMSEFPPAMEARPHHFPQRNRIVAALAEATIVVEAGVRSGALITARLADELGRYVFAIPGDVNRPTSAGTNALIKDGVGLVTGAADVAGLLSWTALQTTTLVSEQDARSLAGILAGRQCDIDELSSLTGLSIADLSAQLTLLEIQGVVQRLPGGLYAAAKPARNGPAQPRE